MLSWGIIPYRPQVLQLHFGQYGQFVRPSHCRLEWHCDRIDCEALFSTEHALRDWRIRYSNEHRQFWLADNLPILFRAACPAA